MEDIPVIPLVSSEYGFDLFSQFIVDGLFDFQGAQIEVDFGDFAHVARKPKRISLISWIKPTLEAPAEVWQTQPSKPRKQKQGVTRRTYLKWLRSGDDEVEQLFAVATERTPFGTLRLRTWFVVGNPDNYLRDLRQGKNIMKAEMVAYQVELPDKVADVTTASALMEARYYESKDILYLNLFPPRAASGMRVVDADMDFLVELDAENDQGVAGFEIHYFSLQEPDWLDAPEFAPYLAQRYQVIDSPIKNGTLPEIFAWARERFLRD